MKYAMLIYYGRDCLKREGARGVLSGFDTVCAGTELGGEVFIRGAPAPDGDGYKRTSSRR